MAIWFREYTLEELNNLAVGNLLSHVGIEFIEIGEDYLRARMPVDQRTMQPFGILHGGASVVLAETIGSCAACMVADFPQVFFVGQEINANHIRPVSSGHVTGTARPLHVGKTSQVWDIRIHDDQEKLVCVSRITMSLAKPKDSAGKG
ncbi:MAG TPA: hotdog fold thioesterase [Geobacteraceae bacterium]|nr:hotdog fold thioesterase [Geobacteraceae bacterium]